MTTIYDPLPQILPLRPSVKEIGTRDTKTSLNWSNAYHLSTIHDMWELTTRPTFEPVEGYFPTIDSLMPYRIEEAEDLLKSRSPEEFSYRQGIVDRKVQAREEDYNNGSWLPATVLGLADPVNFVPFVGPWYKGVGLARGALRLGGGFGAVTAVQEGILTQSIGRPEMEQWFNIGTATLAGGLFGGVLGRIGFQKKVKDWSDLNDNAQAFYDGLSAPAKFPDRVVIRETMDVPVQLKMSDNVMFVNPKLGISMWETKAWTKEKDPLPEETFKDWDQYQRFLMEKEFARHKFKRKPEQKPQDYEKELTETALVTMRGDQISVNNYNGMLTRAELERQPSGSYAMPGLIPISPAHRAIKAFPNDNYLSVQGLELVDVGAQIKGNAVGVAKPYSVEAMTYARWGWVPHEIHHTMERIWMRSKGRDVTDGPQYGGVPIAPAASRLRDTITRVPDSETYEYFMDLVAKRVASRDNESFKLIAGRETDEFIDEAAAHVTGFFKKFEEQALKTGVFGPRGDKSLMRQQIKNNTDELAKTEKAIDKLKASTDRKKNIVEGLEQKSRDGFKEGLSENQFNLLVKLRDEIDIAATEGSRYQRRLGALVAKAHRLRTENVALGKRLEATVGGVKQDYYPHRWLPDVINENEDDFRNLIKDHFIENPETVVFSEKNNRWYVNNKDPETLDARVDATVANIKQEARLAGFDGTLIPERIGSGLRYLNSRVLDIPTEKLMGFVNGKGERINFIDTNVRAMASIYAKRVGSQIEMARKFGDRFGTAHREELSKYIDEKYIFPVLKKLENKKLKPAERKKLQTALQKAHQDKQSYMDNLLDTQHRVLNQFDINDPSAMSTRLAEGMRNWFTLAYGGSFALSAMPDAARPMMVYGAKEFFKAIPEGMRDLSMYKVISKELREVGGDLLDIVNASTLNRFVDQGELAGFGKRSAFERGLTAAQGPMFIANLLGPWTYQWKMFTGLMAGHMMIKYSKDMVAGTLNKHGKETLSMMGIDMNLARKILDQPYQQNGKTYYLNSTEWTDEALRTRIASSVAAETRRVMVQPTIGDKPNIMSGIFRTNNKTALGIAQSKFFKKLGFNVVGNKISHPIAALPFQFMSWPISAMTKVTSEGLQRRDAAVFFGAMGMVSMGYLSGMFKHYNWFDMSFEEQMIRAVELSGVGALFTDAPLMVEEITQGDYGLRSMLGHDPLYDRSEHDAIGRFFGPAIGGSIEVIDALVNPDMRLNERSAIVRRAIPFAGLFYLKGISRFMERNALRPAMGLVYDD